MYGGFLSELRMSNIVGSSWYQNKAFALSNMMLHSNPVLFVKHKKVTFLSMECQFTKFPMGILCLQ